jgi:hypothetical protein
LEEIMTVVVEVQTTSMHVLGHLIEEVDLTKSLRKHNPLGGERPLWIIKLGRALSQMLQHDIPLYYDPSPLAGLKYGLNQAIARHLLTHSNEPTGGWTVDGLIVTVAGSLGSKAMRDARHRLKLDAENLRACGFELSDDRIFKLGKS